jgi:hypothetical protein
MPSIVAGASKALAEKAAWDFVKQNDVSFTLSTCVFHPFLFAFLRLVGTDSSPPAASLPLSFSVVTPLLEPSPLPTQAAPSPSLPRRSTSSLSSLLVTELGSILYVLCPPFTHQPLADLSDLQEHYVSVDDVARIHVDAALNPTISNGHRYLLLADRSSWEKVARSAIEAVPELKGHFPPLPSTLAKEEEPRSKFRYAADRAEKDFGWKCAFSRLSSVRKSQLIGRFLPFLQINLSTSISVLSLSNSLSSPRRTDSFKEQ